MRKGEGRGAAAEASAARAKANWERAEAQIKDWAASKEPITMGRIKEINAILGEGLRNNSGTAGMVRTTGVDVGAAARHDEDIFNPYVPGKDVPAAMEDFLHWYHEAEETMGGPPELAARVYQRLVSIHPFSDANGRTCRMVMDWILYRNGLPPAVLESSEVPVAVYGDEERMGRGFASPQFALEAVTSGIERAVRCLRAALRPGA